MHHHSANYFTLLGLPETFEIDLQALERAYIDAQKKFHPDRLAKEDANARHAAIQQSMEINKAYQTLKSPLQRAGYLLKRRGVGMSEEEGGIKPDQTTLLDSLERREALMEAASSEAVAALQHSARTDMDRQWDRFRDQCTRQEWLDAGQTLIHLTFLAKFLEESGLRHKAIS